MKKLAYSAALAALLVGLMPGVSSAKAPVATPEEKAVAITQPSTVYLEQYWTAYVKIPGGTGYINRGAAFHLTFRCTGFIVSPDGYIATAGHCVDPADARSSIAAAAVTYMSQNNLIYSYYLANRIHTLDVNELVTEATGSWTFEGKDSGSPPDVAVFAQRGTALQGQKSGEAIGARVIASEPVGKGDVAILKVEKKNLPSLAIGSSADLPVGTNVLAVGYPGNREAIADASLDPTFQDGKVSAKSTRSGGTLPIYEINAAVSGGMSGGPAVNLSGEVVGINSMSLSKGTGQAQDASFNYITPVSLLNEMLNANGVKAAIGPADREWRDGLRMYFAGDGKGAVKKFQALEAADPSRPLVHDYVLKAQAVAKTQGGSPVILIVVLAVVLLGGIGGWMAVRSRKSKASGARPSKLADPFAPSAPVDAAAPAELEAVAEPEAPVTPAAPVAPVAPVPVAETASPSFSPAATAPFTAAPVSSPSAPVAPAAPAVPVSQPSAPAGDAKPSVLTTVATEVETSNGHSNPTRYCAKCGAAAETGVNFCKNCGTKL
jgi:hypothetical protein